MTSRWATLALAAAVVTQPAFSQQAEAPVADAEADALHSKLRSLKRRPRPDAPRPSQLPVSASELNAYLQSRYVVLPEGVSEVRVSIDQGHVTGRALVDVDYWARRLPEGTGIPIGALSGGVQVVVGGRLQADSGFGRFHLEEVSLGPFPIPVSAVASLVSAATRTDSDPVGFDIEAPFRLPYSIKRVRLEPGMAWLDF